MSLTTSNVEGDSYYGYSDGIPHLAISVNPFKGRVSVQGNSALTPQTQTSLTYKYKVV